MDKKPKVFEELEKLAALIPATFYWTDINSVIMGVNQNGLKIVGDLSYQDIVGKSPYDMYPIETAKIIDRNTRKVVIDGKTLTFEESLADLTTGKMRYYNVIRAPLYDDGKIVGTIGTTIEITAEKEAAQQQIKMKLIENSSKDIKKTVLEMANWIEAPLSHNIKKLDDILTMLEKLPADHSAEDQKKQIMSIIEDVNHNNKKVGNLVTGVLNKLKKGFDYVNN